jgi:hypothetical protein
MTRACDTCPNTDAAECMGCGGWRVIRNGLEPGQHARKVAGGLEVDPRARAGRGIASCTFPQCSCAKDPHGVPLCLGWA